MSEIDTTLGGNGSFEHNYFTCAEHAYTVYTLRHLIWYIGLTLGVPGNMLSAIIWLRRHVIGKNSSAIHLAALAVNDLAYLLINLATRYLGRYMAEWIVRTVSYTSVMSPLCWNLCWCSVFPWSV